MAFTITLSDGTKLKGLTLNGNNFISKTPLTAETFDGKLSHVVIEGDKEADMTGLIGEHSNMELVRCANDAVLGGYAFILRELSERELRDMKVDARLDYIEMMEEF